MKRRIYKRRRDGYRQHYWVGRKQKNYGMAPYELEYEETLEEADRKKRKELEKKEKKQKKHYGSLFKKKAKYTIPTKKGDDWPLVTDPKFKKKAEAATIMGFQQETREKSSVAVQDTRKTIRRDLPKDINFEEE